MRRLRQFNTRITLTPASSSSAGRIQQQHLGALFLDYVRGVALVAVGLTSLLVALPVVDRYWLLPEQVGRIAVAAATAGALAATVQLFRGRKRALLFGAGVVAGLLLGVFR